MSRIPGAVPGPSRTDAGAEVLLRRLWPLGGDSTLMADPFARRRRVAGEVILDGSHGSVLDVLRCIKIRLADRQVGATEPVALEPGDVVCFPVGPEGGHRVHNASDDAARVIDEAQARLREATPSARIIYLEPELPTAADTAQPGQPGSLSQR